MAEQSIGEALASQQVPSIAVPEEIGEAITVSEAARILAQARAPKPKATIQEAVNAVAAGEGDQSVEPPQVSAEAEAAPDEASGEQEATEADQPPIEPPKFWTKDAKDHWDSIPRATQEYLSERETERDREVDRRLKEVADKSKDYESKASAAEQERQKYEAALPLLLQQQMEHFSVEFPEVRTPSDVERVLREDPAKYLLIKHRLEAMQGTQLKLQDAHIRQADARRANFVEFAKNEDDAFTKLVPADELKALRENAEQFMTERGFSPDELGKAWIGEKDISIRDHRVQLLIRDAMRWRDSQSSTKKLAEKRDLQLKAKPVPRVQRPGAAPQQGADRAQQIAGLQKALETATGRRAIEIGTQLLELQRGH